MNRLILSLLAALILVSGPGCNLLSSLPVPAPAPAPAPDDKTDPAPAPKPPEFSESDYWAELAAAVEAGIFSNSDQIYLTAKKLADRGFLKDLGRIDSLKSKRVDVTDSNKSDLAKTIRGT